MSDTSLGTPEQLRDPNYTPPLGKAIPLGIQHVLAMFVSNFTPAIIIAGAAGFAFGSDDRTYLIQMSIMFAGIATLLQTIGAGPVGARLPIVQGTSFAFIPIMFPIAKFVGMGALMGAIIVGGIFHFFLGTVVKRIRHWLPPLVTGLIVLMIGLALIKVGIEYAAGGAGDFNRGKETWGGGANWFVAFIVIAVTLGLKFFTKGMWSLAAVLLGLIAGYLVAALMGMVSLGAVNSAGWFALPSPFKYGIEFNMAAIIGMCLMAVVSAIETVGDTSGITKGGAGREATDEEVAGATYADGLGTAVAGIFGGLPNTSFSQNVGLISMTGVMSRTVVTIGAIFLIACGLVPKIGALIASMPLPVLGGGVIVMFGMVAAAGARMLADVIWNQRNMLIFAIALSVGLGLQLVPDALKFLDPRGTLNILLTSGLLPAAIIAILLNLFLPEDPDGNGGGEHQTQMSGLGATGTSGANAGAGLKGASTLAAGVQDGSITTSTVAGSAAAGIAAGGAALASGMNKTASAVSNAGSATSKAASKTGKAVKSTTDKVAKATATKGKAKTTKAKAKRAVNKAAKSTGKAATTAASKTSAAAKSASKKTAKATRSAAKTTKSATKTAAAKTEKGSAAAKSTAKKAATKARTVASKAKTTAKKATAPKTTAKTSNKLAKGAGSAVDNLEFVDGIGPKTSKSLQGAGVKNLSGLVAMSDAKLETAAQKAGTGGRPKSENWKKQAKDILGGKPPRAKSDRAAWERARKKG